MDKELIDLDECVINALQLFTRTKLPKVNFGEFKRPLVVGSCNAFATGRILFSDKDVVIANESDYQQKLKTIKTLDGCFIISASGGKHAPLIAKDLRKKRIRSTLLTNNPSALASKFVNNTFVYPKNPEPYTYNTSTYLGMILSKTKEDPEVILAWIDKIKPLIPSNLSSYDSVYLIVPKEFDLIREMFLTKFDELFGPMVSARAFTVEQSKHAKTVVPSNKELFISFGFDNNEFGISRLNIPLPKLADYGTLLAVGYYVIGQLQKQNPPYFKDNLKNYVENASKIFGETIPLIVE